jgi:hypothetical protein
MLVAPAMTRYAWDMRAEDLLNRIYDQPFKPFRVHLSDGSRLDISEPGMLIVGQSTAVVPSVWTKDEEGRRLAKHWRTIALSHIVQFGEIDETIENKRRKRK